MDDQVLWTIGIILVSFLVTGGVVLLLIPRGKVAETLVEAGNTFELQCAPKDARQYKLFARYGVNWDRGGHRSYGLVFDLLVMVDDQIVYQQKLGIGYNTPDEVDVVSGTEFFVSSSRGPGSNSRTATVTLLELGPRSANSSIVVTGKVIPAPNTFARPTKIYIAR